MADDPKPKLADRSPQEIRAFIAEAFGVPESHVSVSAAYDWEGPAFTIEISPRTVR